ncbi:hypothetical protein [Pedobacter sp. SYSU D00535]|uniref:hypothetical protein n=1 Tax=Pedobacter sp. SYSU D00535 TaxID=2810308 RepID=UPI001A972389|nr:hypothetical protein [Pedobacter sp. SYSU D00535]
MITYKNILFFMTAALCVLLAIYSFTLHKKLSQKEKVEQTVSSKIQEEAKIISRKVDAAGLEHVTIEAAGNIIPKAQANAAVSEGILDTTAMAIGILKKQIENLLVVNSTLKADNLRAIQRLDERQNPVYSYQDKYLNLNYTPGDPTDTADKGSFDFQYNADLTITQYWKRNKVLGLPLGSKNSYIDIYSNDPRTIVNGVKKLTVQQEQPLLGLRVQGVTSYDFTSGTLRPGAEIQFDAGRASFTGAYLYDPITDKWRPTVTGRYDLIRF